MFHQQVNWCTLRKVPWLKAGELRLIVSLQTAQKDQACFGLDASSSHSGLAPLIISMTAKTCERGVAGCRRRVERKQLQQLAATSTAMMMMNETLQCTFSTAGLAAGCWSSHVSDQAEDNTLNANLHMRIAVELRLALFKPEQAINNKK
jgi:hypothetical protein